MGRTRTFHDILMKGVAPVILVICTSILGVLIFQSKEGGDEKYSVHLAVLLAEALKFIVCLFVITFIDSPPSPSLPSPTSPTPQKNTPPTPTTTSPTPTTTTSPTTTLGKIVKKVEEYLPYTVPASIYAVDNTVHFILLEYFSPPVLLVLQNIKVLVTGFVYTLVFKKQLSWVQWLALVSVTLGIILVGFRKPSSSSPPSSSPPPSPSSHPPLVGFLLLSMAALLGSFGNVFCEKLLKGGDREGLSLSQQNLRLYFFGIILNLLWTWTNDEGHMKEKGIFHDFNVFAVLSIITMAVVGLLISVVFKYLTSIVQVLCSVLSAFLVSIISITLGVFEPTEFFVFGSVLIFLGVFLYANPTVCMKLVSYVM